MRKEDMLQILDWLFGELHEYKPPSNKQPEVSDAEYLFLWLLKTHTCLKRVPVVAMNLMKSRS
jgi:hypothetical protein